MSIIGHFTITIALSLAFFLLSASPTTAQEIDIDEFSRLLDAGISAHQAIEDAEPGVPLDPLLEDAVRRDDEIVSWLDTTIASEAFQSLDTAQQLQFVNARNRTLYLRATLQTRLGQCDTSRQVLRVLIDSTTVDAELRPRLISAYDNAVECLEHTPVATLELEATPADAEVFVDGVFVGMANSAHPIELGAHQLVVRSPGYLSREFTVQASRDGEVIRLGGVVLQPEVPENALDESRQAPPVAVSDVTRPEPTPERVHDGFHVRSVLGFGYSAGSESYDNTSISLDGFSLLFSAALGGAVIENLIIDADFFGSVALSPSVSASDIASSDAEAVLVGVGIGAGVTYYFAPSKFYVASSAGISFLRASQDPDLDIRTNVGVGFDAAIGIEWPALREVDLGLALMAIFLNGPDSAIDARLNIVGIGLGLSLSRY